MENLNEALMLMLRGIAVVFAVMTLIAGATWLAGKVFVSLDEKDKERKKAEEEKKKAEKERKKAERERKKAEREKKKAEEAAASGPTADEAATEEATVEKGDA